MKQVRAFAIGLVLVAAGYAAGKPKDKATSSQVPKNAPEYRIAWSHYTGWEPWSYADHSGILAKWAQKYGIRIKLDLINDYVESINLYTSGKYVGCVMTNMDALTNPAAAGIDSTVLLVGSFSHGNDGIVIKNGSSVADLKGRRINLVELSVSHYLLARALSLNGLKERDVTIVHTSDSDIGTLYLTSDQAAAVTWNPILSRIAHEPKSNLIFDSKKIPGEIMDLFVINTSAPDTLKKALVGAWYETMAAFAVGAPQRKSAVEFMATGAGASVKDFESQLLTTEFLSTPQVAQKFVTDAKLPTIMDQVRAFSFGHGLFGPSARSADVVGISFPDGKILGDSKRVRLRFDTKMLEAAAQGKL